MIDYKQELLNAPPRICDLRGDELRAALFARDAQHRREWLASRSRRSLLERLFDRFAGKAVSS